MAIRVELSPLRTRLVWQTRQIGSVKLARVEIGKKIEGRAYWMMFTTIDTALPVAAPPAVAVTLIVKLPAAALP
jgi:hypothetical protein